MTAAIISITVAVIVWMGLRFARRMLVYRMIYNVLMKWGYPPAHFDIEEFTEEVFMADEVQQEFKQERRLLR